MRTHPQFYVIVALLVVAIGFMRFVSRDEVVPPRNSFSTFPMNLGEWRGNDAPLDPEILKVLQVTDYLSRWYSNGKGDLIGLYIGYYKTQREGVTYHSPKNCLPGSGWYVVGSGKEEIEVPGNPGRRVTVNRYIIEKGLERMLVLYWYQDRGRTIASEYWAKIHLFTDAMTRNRTDGSLVRIISPMNGSLEETLRREVKFAQLLFPLLGDYLPN